MHDRVTYQFVWLCSSLLSFGYNRKKFQIWMQRHYCSQFWLWSLMKLLLSLFASVLQTSCNLLPNPWLSASAYIFSNSSWNCSSIMPTSVSSPACSHSRGSSVCSYLRNFLLSLPRKICWFWECLARLYAQMKKWQLYLPDKPDCKLYHIWNVSLGYMPYI